jgi:hypothetical protein
MSALSQGNSYDLCVNLGGGSYLIEQAVSPWVNVATSSTLITSLDGETEAYVHGVEATIQLKTSAAIVASLPLLDDTVDKYEFVPSGDLCSTGATDGTAIGGAGVKYWFQYFVFVFCVVTFNACFPD